jgi:hypothetical protein
MEVYQDQIFDMRILFPDLAKVNSILLEFESINFRSTAVKITNKKNENRDTTFHRDKSYCWKQMQILARNFTTRRQIIFIVFYLRVYENDFYTSKLNYEENF